MNDKPKLNLTALCLILSCGCNLQCEYCYIAKSNKLQHDYATFLQKETLKSLQNGTFLQNTKDLVQKFQANPKDIRTFSFWGQEPTLTLHEFTNHFNDWLEAFPNIDRIIFSTNGMGYRERLLNYIKTVDSTITHPIELSIQFSYDGEYSTNNIRKASSKIIYENAIWLVSELNKVKLNYVSVNLHFHGVLSFQMMKYLDTYEKIYEYCLELNKLVTICKEQCFNKSVSLSPQALCIEGPFDASTTDGLLFSEFVTKLEQVEIDTKTNFAEQLLGGGLTALPNNINLDQFVVDNLNGLVYNSNDMYKKQNGHSYCSNNIEELKILYDGTLVNCQNHLFETKEIVSDNQESLEISIKKSLINKHYFLQPLLDTDEEIEKNLYLFRTIRDDTFPFRFQQHLNLMKLLAKTGEISSEYLYDSRKLLLHCFMLTSIKVCSYNYIVKTGSTIVRDAGFIRMYCNGFLDQAENYYIRKNQRENF